MTEMVVIVWISIATKLYCTCFPGEGHLHVWGIILVCATWPLFQPLLQLSGHRFWVFHLSRSLLQFEWPKLCSSFKHFSIFILNSHLFVQILCLNQGWHSCASACHRPFIFPLHGRTNFNLKAYHHASTWTRMYSQWSKNIPWKIIDNVPFLSTNLSKYRVTYSK